MLEKCGATCWSILSKRELAELVEEMKIGSNNFFSKLLIFWWYFKEIYKIFL